MRWLWLAMVVWGTVHPMFWFITWFQDNTWSIMAMVDAWHVNAATSGLVWDLTVAAAALTIWALYTVWTSRIWVFLAVIPATFCIGVSCGLPLMLYLREVKFAEN